MKHAIIRNDIGFRYIKDDELILDTPANQSNEDRVLDLWGLDIAKSLVEINHYEGTSRISGFIIRPPTSRGNRQREYFSIRKRPIEDKRMSQVIESAYSTMLMTGRYPIFALDIEIDVERVDANVHPTKREVRVQDIDDIIEMLHRIVSEALQPPLETEPTHLQDFTSETLTERIPSEQIPGRERQTVIIEQGLLDSRPIVTHEEGLGGVFRILGQVNDLYLLIELDNDLVIIDQHAAHERILYEMLRETVNKSTVIVQELLEPIVIRLDSTTVEQILEVSEILEEVGYSISEFGGNEILISSLPEVLNRRTTENDLIALVDTITQLGTGAKDKFMDDIVKVTACHAAFRAGETLDNEQIRKLIVDLSKTTSKNYCCHGRPSMVRVTRVELDKRFGRDGHEALKRYKARHGLS
jgi:DNA mismatch repair protein MutL